MYKDIPEARGTPIPVKTPINFKARKQSLENSNRSAMKKLIIASCVSFVFIVVQVIGGYLANSIAIFTDSAHLASDIIGFAISIISLKIAQRPATKSLSYGYHRSEVIGTLVSVIFIWGLTIWLVYEATLRILDTEAEVIGHIMLFVAVLGLCFNLIQMKILHSGDGHYHLGGDMNDSHDHSHGHGHHHDNGPKKSGHSKVKGEESKNLKEGLIVDNENQATRDAEHHGHHHHEEETTNINITSAYLHVLGDMLMSVGVVIASIIIYIEPSWKIADPLCTYLFSVIICFTTIPVFKECINVLLEATPTSIDVEQLEQDILDCQGVEEVHDFHVWAISVSKYSMSVHIKSDTPLKSLSQVTDLCRRQYKLFHTTIQVESSGDNKHQFICENDLHD
ncbi:zinc transporter of isoform 1 [Stylonychia lemnae]|uniref:Zinc transporter of isoform 1 n=1 Tax=Stylonychia lemnae TaxID=5949 RepID=A0A078AP65_STYLE|nr:zinc transporter of isoform 1 [Stylonychia lemnae]|eukprot:CDW83914.1 zinc transporter of isoform 1 [Stylonychia lemnae]